MAGRGRDPGRSVTSRVLAILAAFDDSHPRLRLSEIARRAGLPPGPSSRQSMEPEMCAPRREIPGITIIDDARARTGETGSGRGPPGRRRAPQGRGRRVKWVDSRAGEGGRVGT
jgi:hypothetical protein